MSVKYERTMKNASLNFIDVTEDLIKLALELSNLW